VPNMQNECVKIRSDTRQPHRMGAVAQSRNYTLCSARIRVRMRLASYPSVRSATWDSGTDAPLCALSTGRALEKSTQKRSCIYESRQHSATTRIPFCSPRASGMLRPAYQTLSRCHRTESHPLARSRGFVA
jgi:hypothetical protein